MVDTKLLDIQQLCIKAGGRVLVDQLSFSLKHGEFMGIAGESGSGKTLTCYALAGLLDSALSCSGKIRYYRKNGIEIRLDETNYSTWQTLRREELAFVFQEPMSALNPTLQCGTQLLECLSTFPRREHKERAANLLEACGLDDTLRIMKSYPFQLSGGQRQRLMIAMALANNPKLLLVDEPTTALDAELKYQVTELLTELCRMQGTAVVMVSHDLDLLGNVCDSLLVLQQGKVVEYGDAKTLTRQPTHAYTHLLMDCRPSLDKRGVRLSDGYESPKADTGKTIQNPKSGITLLEVDAVSMVYKRQNGTGNLRALDGVSLNIKRGETLCILGQSGSGKSTLAKILCGLEKQVSGNIRFHGNDTGKRGIQMVFQDPFSALNPEIRVWDALMEVIQLKHRGTDRSILKDKCKTLLQAVRLPESSWHAFPRHLSGGQCQRVSIARSLANEPELLILDESVAALDPSVQASVLNLLADLQREMGLGYIFITHDLDVAAYFSDRLHVLLHGRTDCCGETQTLFLNPPSDYTRKLFAYLRKMN
jgi:peptide/nickel transport system ATP-binding protein